MSEFRYEGVDRAGQKTSGKIDAQNEGSVRMMLREKGIRPTSIKSALATPGIKKKSGAKIPSQALVLFTRQLQVLIGAGVPIVQGLEILVEQTELPALKSITIDIKEKVSQGSYFWEALSAYPNAFPKLYVALIRAGESSGSIDQMLKRLARYVEDADRMKKMLKGAMVYPAIVMLIGIGVVAMMMIFVIPTFEEMLKTNKQGLPEITQFVINLSHFMIANWPFIFGGAGLTGYIARSYVKTPEGRAVMDRITFRLPIFGSLVQKSGVARFSRTMQTLLQSGVNLLDAIEICKLSLDNAVLEAAASKIRAEVEAGKTLGMVIANLEVFPKLAIQMISVGESTGNLDKMLEKIADFYESETENVAGVITKLIEPIILVFLGGTVGGIMIAMYLPIFKMAGGVD